MLSLIAWRKRRNNGVAKAWHQTRVALLAASKQWRRQHQRRQCKQRSVKRMARNLSSDSSENQRHENVMTRQQSAMAWQHQRQYRINQIIENGESGNMKNQW